jgi:hypothetical protein
MLEAKDQFSFTGKLGENRRGDYRAITTGVSHGGGSTVGLMHLYPAKRLTYVVLRARGL